MKFGLRQKITVGFSGLLVFLLVVGSLSIFLLNQYSSTLEQIFNENYNSVIYSQKMKDGIESLDDFAQKTLWSTKTDTEIRTEFNETSKIFEQYLQKELANVTLPGEGELAQNVEKKWHAYKKNYETTFLSSMKNRDGLRLTYLGELRPQQIELKQLLQKIEELNLANIVSVDGQVKGKTAAAKRTMYGLLFSGILTAIVFSGLIARSILRPLRIMTESVREIERGNLDLKVPVESDDELGDLATAFNAMTMQLREFRRTDRAKLFRIQRTTQLALNSFPDAVAVVRPDGRVELANTIAREQFLLLPETDLSKIQPKFLWSMFQKAYTTTAPVYSVGYENAIQIFLGTEEHFFLPLAIPILSEDKTLTGVTLVLNDVTNLRRLDEMKSSLLSVVSHELKTPLTSIRMATHLLLEERVGPLTSKQVELLVTARDDAEKLSKIIENLLDLGRMESGRGLMELTPISVDGLLLEVSQNFDTIARDKGIILRVDVGEDVPKVLVDRNRIDHVFSNLLQNAIKFTASGGEIFISAQRRDNEEVCFQVTDTGIGIPEEFQSRIFEKFFRVPGSSLHPGAGLGLAIAREIVEAHGGRMSLEKSQTGRGSTFAFTLRAAPPSVSLQTKSSKPI